MRLADRAVVNALRIKIGRVPWTRYVADHRATCFLLTSPITTNYLASGCVFVPELRGEERNKGQNPVVELNWKIIAPTSVTTKTCRLTTSVYAAAWMETGAGHVGCSEAINRGMWSTFNTRQSKQRNFPNKLNTPGHGDTKEGLSWSKNQQPAQHTGFILLPIPAWKRPRFRLEVLSLGMSGEELIKAQLLVYML